MVDQVGYWVLVVFGFGFLIFAHELGHFAAAKCVGIRVIRFALGFGPRLFGKQIGQTDYCVCLIPCGGYVKMAGGEGMEEDEATGQPDEFPSKTPGQRAIVVLAGPVMSVLVALPLLFMVFVVGMERPSSRVNHVLPGKPAWRAGIKRGDLITGLRQKDETSWKTIHLWRQVKLNSVLKDKVGDIVVRVERDGVDMEFDLTTTDTGLIGLSSATVGKNVGCLTTKAGFRPPGSPADQAGIVPGSQMLEVADRRVHTWDDVRRSALENPGKALPVRFRTPEGEERASELSIGTEGYWSLGVIARRPARIGLVRPNFPAEDAKLKSGDLITRVGAHEVKNWPELRRRILDAGPTTVTLTYERTATPESSGAGARKGSVVEVETVDVALGRGEEIGDVLGVGPVEHVIVEGFLPGNQAEEAGIRKGARLVKARLLHSTKEPIEIKHTDIVHLLSWTRKKFNPDATPPQLELTFEQDGGEQTATVGLIAAERGPLALDPRLDTCHVVPPGRPVAALRQAVVETLDWISLAGRGLWMLCTGQLSFDMMSGPVMILTATRYRAEAGFTSFIEFLVLITVHLGVINLVPFPILDGGHVLFLIIEKIRGKPLPEKAMAWLMYAGMTLLIALMLLVTGNDILKLVQIFSG